MKIKIKSVGLFFILVLNIGIMIPHKKKLIDFAFDMYSQSGEDGIIKKIFEIIGTSSKIAIEFGAWDGIQFSNTANLWIRELAWRAILIECDPVKFKTLVENCKGCSCLPLQEYVGIDETNSLEAILQKHEFNFDEEVDILSIDVDGNDYHIFNSLKILRPRLIICEYNPTMPHDLDLYAPYSIHNLMGQSVAALNRIAQEKGYKLVALTMTNAFYVQEKDFSKFQEYETDPDKIKVNHIVAYVTTYDGRHALVGKHNSLYYGLKGPYGEDLCGNFSRIDRIRTVRVNQ